MALIDAIGALQRSDIGNNTGDLRLGDAVDWRHVAKAPMVRSRAELSRNKKRPITMMARLIDAMDKRRRHTVLPRGIVAMAGPAFGIVDRFANAFCCTKVRHHDGHERRTAGVGRCLIRQQVDGQASKHNRACAARDP